jgi:hypothetical protein
MKEAPGFSGTSVLTRATRLNIPEDTFLYSHRRENLKSYMCEGELPVRKLPQEVTILSTESSYRASLAQQ